MKSWPFTLRIRHRFGPLPACRWRGRQRNRCCSRRSVRSGPEGWEAVNRAVLASAKQDRLESGATVRIDSTVTAALMHEPSDSALLLDAVRLMTRLLRQAAALPGAPALQWRDRRRMAKKRAQAIEYSRNT